MQRAGYRDFEDIRRHGADGEYASGYTTEQLRADAKAINKFLKDGKDVFLYFNNEAEWLCSEKCKGAQKYS